MPFNAAGELECIQHLSKVTIVGLLSGPEYPIEEDPTLRKINRFEYLIGGAIITALSMTALIYWPGLDGPWILDDLNNIPPAFIDKLDWDQLIYIVTSNGSGPLGRPISMLSFALTSLLHGAMPWGFKLHNLTIHLWIGCLLFWLGGRICSREFYQDTPNRGWAIAGVATLLWLLHPIQVSSVLYVVQRMAQLAVLFSVLALLCYVIGRQNLLPKPKLAILLLFIAFPTFLMLAVLSKESGVLTLAFVAIIEIFVFRRNKGVISSNRQIRLFMVIFFLVLMTISAFVIFRGHVSLLDYSHRNFTLSERLLSEGIILTEYLRMIILPRLSLMTLFHDDFEVVREITPGVCLHFVFLVGLILGAFQLRRREPLIALGVIWYFCAHLLESTIFPLELMFEHRNYLAVFGPMICVATLLFKLKKDGWKTLITLMVAGSFTVLTAMQAKTWADGDRLIVTSLAEHPNSKRARVNYVSNLVSKGNIVEAAKQLFEGITRFPNESLFYFNLIKLQCDYSTTVSAELTQKIEKILTSKPINTFDMIAIDGINQTMLAKKCGNYSAEQHYHMIALALNYYEQSSLQNSLTLGSLYHLRGQAAYNMGAYDMALADLEKSYQVHPAPHFLIETIKLATAVGRLDIARRLLDELHKMNQDGKLHYQYKLAELEENFIEQVKGNATQ